MALPIKYKINGTEIPCPGQGRWIARRKLGTDGNNHLIYEPTYTFEISWKALTATEFKQLYDFWNTISSSGTVTASIPGRSSDPFALVDYAGCTLTEPEHRRYESGFHLGIKMLVRNISI